MIFAVAIFLIILTFSLTLWDHSREKAAFVSERAEMEMKAENAMYSLLLSTGNPGNWYENESFSSLGMISSGDYQLDVQKVEGLVVFNSSYTNTSRALAVTKYSLYIRILNGSTVMYSFGVLPSRFARDVVVVERLALLQERPVRVVAGVWQ